MRPDQSGSAVFMCFDVRGRILDLSYMFLHEFRDIQLDVGFARTST